MATIGDLKLEFAIERFNAHGRKAWKDTTMRRYTCYLPDVDPQPECDESTERLLKLVRVNARRDVITKAESDIEGFARIAGCQ